MPASGREEQEEGVIVAAAKRKDNGWMKSALLLATETYYEDGIRFFLCAGAMAEREKEPLFCHPSLVNVDGRFPTVAVGAANSKKKRGKNNMSLDKYVSLILPHKG